MYTGEPPHIKQIPTDLKGEITSNTVKRADFNTAPTSVDTISRKKHCPYVIHQAMWTYIYMIIIYAQSLSCVKMLFNPRTVDCQAPLSLGVYGKECWSELPFSS